MNISKRSWILIYRWTKSFISWCPDIQQVFSLDPTRRSFRISNRLLIIPWSWTIIGWLPRCIRNCSMHDKIPKTNFDGKSVQKDDPTLSLGMSENSEPYLTKICCADKEGLTPTWSFVRMAAVSGDTLNWFDTNLTTWRKGVSGGTLTVLKGNLGSEVFVILNTIFSHDAILSYRQWVMNNSSCCLLFELDRLVRECYGVCKPLCFSLKLTTPAEPSKTSSSVIG